AAFAGDAVDRWRTGRRTAAAFHREQARAATRHPDAVLLVTPRTALDARRLRSLLDEPRAGNAATCWTELLLIILAVAFDLATRPGTWPRRRTIPAEIELAGTALRYPNAAAVVAPGATLDTGGL